MHRLRLEVLEDRTTPSVSAVPDAGTVAQNQTLTGPSVLANDVYTGTGLLTAQPLASPMHGMLSLQTNGTYSYTPWMMFTGQDQFSYTATDGFDSDTTTVTITVTGSSGGGGSVVANDDAFSITQGTTLTSANVLGNDSGPPGTPLTPQMVTGPQHGMGSFNQDGTLNYQPNSGFVGTDTLTYKDLAGMQSSNDATVTITVGQAPPPVAYDASLTAAIYNPASGTFNATDPLGRPLTYTVMAYPTHGAVGVNGANFTYTPMVGYAGIDTFTFKANDGLNDSNVATITVNDIVPGPNFTWTGAADSHWGNFNNWIDQQGMKGVPGASDNVLFTGAYNVPITVDWGFSGTVHGVTIDANYTQQITLQQAFTAVITNQYGGTISGSSYEVPNLGSYNWYSGKFQGFGSLEIHNGATLNMAGATDLIDNGWEINNHGIANWTAGNFLGTDVMFTNASDGTFTAQGNLTWFDVPAAPPVPGLGSEFINLGTVRVLGSSTNLVMNVPFYTSSLVNLDGGSTVLREGGEIGGDVTGGAGQLRLARGLFVTPGNTRITAGQPVVIAGMGDQAILQVGVGETRILELRLTDRGVIDGPGLLTITGDMTWDTGRMQGSGNTVINPGAELAIPATVDMPDPVLARRLINNGRVNAEPLILEIASGGAIENHGTYVGDVTIYNLDTGAEITNYGTFRVELSVNIPMVIRSVAADDAPRPSFDNHGTLTLVGNVIGCVMEFRSGMNFNNDGQVNLNTSPAPGETRLDIYSSGTLAGTFNAATGTEVMFKDGTNILDPGNSGPTYMLRGEGLYVLTGDSERATVGTLTVADGIYVTANYFELRAGTLDGKGTFNAHLFYWLGGTMADAGVTVVEFGDRMQIAGLPPSPTVTLVERTITNRGLIKWGLPFLPPDVAAAGAEIDISQGGKIDNDGGEFDVYTNDDMVNVNDSAGKFIVRNGGIFRKELNDPGTPLPAATTIGLSFENDDGDVYVFDSLQLPEYRQTGQYAETYLSGFLRVSNLQVSSGLFSLDGGELTDSNQGAATQFGHDSTLWGYGTFFGNLVVGGTLSLGSTLTVTGGFYFQGLTAHLNGYFLINQDSAFRLYAGTLYLDGGRIYADGPLGLLIADPAVLTGSGTIIGNVQNSGTIFVGAFGTAGSLFIQGDFYNSSTDNLGGTISFAVNGLTDGNQLSVTGNMSLGGRLVVIGSYDETGYLPLIVFDGLLTTDPQFQIFNQVTLLLPGAAKIEYGDNTVWLHIP